MSSFRFGITSRSRTSPKISTKVEKSRKTSFLLRSHRSCTTENVYLHTRFRASLARSMRSPVLSIASRVSAFMVAASCSSMTAITRSKRRSGLVILTTPLYMAIVVNRWSVIERCTRLPRRLLWAVRLPLFDAHTAMTYSGGQSTINVRGSVAVEK